jgi:hypothetical protein
MRRLPVYVADVLPPLVVEEARVRPVCDDATVTVTAGASHDLLYSTRTENVIVVCVVPVPGVAPPEASSG